MRTEIIGRRFLRNVLLITTLLLFLVRIGAQGRGMVIKTAEGKEVGSFESSYALVIGESDYTEGWPDLPGVILKTDGTLWATGRNGDGQLGDGTTTGRSTPIQIMK